MCQAFLIAHCSFLKIGRMPPRSTRAASNVRARIKERVGGNPGLVRDDVFGDAQCAGCDGSRDRAIRPSPGGGGERGLFPPTATRDEAALQALVSNEGVSQGLDALVTELQ